MSESDRPLRAGVIGCGFFAQNHLNAWQHMLDVELTAVCDVDPDKAQKAAHEFGVPAWYQDAAIMVNDVELDFMDIATTPPSHRQLVELAAHRRLPAICQKPLALDLEDAEAIAAAVKRSGIPFMVHENFRWQAPMRILRRYLEEGTIGRPFFGQISWRTGSRALFSNQPYLREQPRLVLADMGGHLFDLARFFFGRPTALACQVLKIHPDIAGEDVATVLLEYDGATCIVDMSYSGRSREDLFPQTIVHLEGENGALDLGPHYEIIVSNRDGEVEREHVSISQYDWSVPLWDVVQDSVYQIQRHWVECLRAGETPENSAEENIDTYRLVEGAYDSAETGRFYRPDPS